MRMNGDQKGRARKLVAVLSGLGCARPFWRVMRGVKYQDHEAVIFIHDGILLEGEIPLNKMKLVQAWIEIHNEDLMADWELAINGQNVFKIDPLK